MNFKNEKQLIFVIRYSLPIIILLLSIIITTFLYFENKTNFEIVKKNTEEKFMADKKQIIKEQVDNVYQYILEEQKATENNLKASLISRVHEAHTIATNIYNDFKETRNKEELTKIIRSAIKDIRFNNNRGYFFVYDKKATNIIHPLIPRLEGKNLINHQDTKGTYVLRESLKLLEYQDESYQEWYWRKDKNDLTQYRKIGFVKDIYELGWFIGTGEYVQDFTKDIQQKVLTQIEKLKFGTNSYFIVTDKENNYLSHINKSLIGKNALQKLQDMNDQDSLQQIQNVIDNKEGYVYLKFYKPGSTEISFKIIYLKTVPGWDWVISTGFYKDDINVLINKTKENMTQSYNENLKSLLFFTILITASLLILSFYISRMIEEKFKNYKNSIQHHMTQNEKQAKLLAQKSKLAAMGEMIENIAHQWRQPLSVITTAASGIRVSKEVENLTDELLDKSLDNITTSALHLSETIEDFSDFFKPDKEKSTFTLESAVKRTFKLLSSQINEKEITVIENIQNIEILGYERELLQTLLNIVNNARDALEKCTEKKYIFIDIQKMNNQALIQIKDNAGGIPQDIIERIFEPYFTTKHKSQGTGIGLYMSQELISRHMKGTLEVENKTYTYKNKTFTGALFTIYIPLD